MSKKVELADGQTLEFPDDTPDEVINMKVKEMLGIVDKSEAEKFYQLSQSGALTGARDFIGSMATDSALFPASGIAGAVTAPFYGNEQAVENVKSVQALNPGVDTEVGRAMQESTATGMGKLADVGNTIMGGLTGIGALASGQSVGNAASQVNSIQDQGFIRFAEDAMLEAGVPPEMVAIIKGGIGAKMFHAGVKSQVGVRPGKTDIMKQKLAHNSTDTDTAKYQLTAPEPENLDWRDPNTVTKSNRPFQIEDMRVKTDPGAQSLISHGFEKEMIPPVREASKIDVSNMREMTKTAQRMTENGISRITDSPLDVIGQSLLGRYKFIRKEMITVGRNVNAEAQKLKGLPVDFTPAVGNFESALESMGIKINRDGNYALDYSDSIIKGKLLKQTRKAIDDVVEQMKSVKGTPDAFQVHNFKKALDEILEWGSTKGKDGFAGKTERIVKQLRRDMDDILDGKFKDYDKANTDYATLAHATDQFSEILGKKVDPYSGVAASQVGQQLRKLGSNYASKYPIFNAITIIDDVANQFKGKFKDNLVTQVMFANKLNKRFALDGDNTFKALTTQAELDAMTKAGMVRNGYEKVRELYRNDHEAFKALNKYLKELEAKK